MSDRANKFERISSEALVEDICPAHIWALLRPAAFRTSRASSVHALMFRKFAKTVKPRDFIEWIFVMDCVDARCAILWLKTVRTQLVEKPIKDHICCTDHPQYTANDAKIEQLREKRAVELRVKISHLKGTPESVKIETDRLEAKEKCDLEVEIEKMQLEIYKELKRQELALREEMNDSDWLSEWIGPYEKIEDRIQMEEQKFNKALDHLDQYRHGLGERLRKVVNETIEGQYEEMLDWPATNESSSTMRKQSASATSTQTPSAEEQTSPEE
jgi:hypothetical protein